MAALPKLSELKKKEITLKGPNIPPGLDHKYVRSAEGIPTSYIKKNFSLEEHRGKRVTLGDGVGLFANIINEILQTSAATRLSSDDPDDEGDNEEELMEGVVISSERLRMALRRVVDSDTLFQLFTTGKVFEYYDELHTGVPGIPRTKTFEIILCKQKVSYDSDETVIAKIKRKVFAEIQRYRRAKEKI